MKMRIFFLSLPAETNHVNVMRRFLLCFLLLASITSMAQYKGHGGHPVPGQPSDATLTIVAARQQAFWLFVDDVLQNEQPVHSIRINGLWPEVFYVRVELDNAAQNSVGQYVDLRQSQVFSIAQRGNLFGLEASNASVRPELTMGLRVAHEPIAPPAPRPLSTAEFDEVCALIERESYDKTRLTVAKQVTEANRMTAKQIEQITRLFSFESNKLEFAKFAYLFCIDPNKYYMVNEAFSYDSSKQELNEYIKGL